MIQTKGKNMGKIYEGIEDVGNVRQSVFGTEKQHVINANSK